MKIAFASEHPNQMSSFSGTPFHMFQALHAASESATYITTPGYELESILQDRDKGLRQLRKAGEYLSDQLEKIEVDVVICQGSSMIPFLRTDKPVILWHDATWLGLMQIGFEEFKNKYPFLYDWDRMTFERCDLVLFAADWVRDQTIRHYKTDPHKTHTVPFGANMLPQSLEVIETFIHNRKESFCQLTFLGVDWRRKGLLLAYQVCKTLNERGIPSKLNVIGSEIEAIGIKRQIKHYAGYQRYTATEVFQLRFHKDPIINSLGFLKKDNPEDYAKLCETLQNSHFLLHPASFECFGIALVEANAFGVPVIATDSYGPQTIIRNGLNGYLFDTCEYVERASTLIQQYMENYTQYQTLALNSFFEQQHRLDWTKSVQKLCEILFSAGFLAHQPL